MKTAQSSSVATSVLPFNNDAFIHNHNAQHHSKGRCGGVKKRGEVWESVWGECGKCVGMWGR